MNSNSQPHVIVNICDKPIKMIVDSGTSYSNIVNKNIAEKLVQCGAKTVNKATKIYQFGFPPLISSHYIEGNIEYNGICFFEEIIVMDSDVSALLCKSTAEKLGVLKITVNSVTVDSLTEKYPIATSKKLGKLKGHMVKLQINESVPQLLENITGYHFIYVKK